MNIYIYVRSYLLMMWKCILYLSIILLSILHSLLETMITSFFIDSRPPLHKPQGSPGSSEYTQIQFSIKVSQSRITNDKRQGCAFSVPILE